MLYDMRMKHLTLLDPSIQVPQKHRTTMEQLVLDVHNLMIGVPSHTFLYDRVRYRLLMIGVPSHTFLYDMVRYRQPDDRGTLAHISL